LKETHQLIAGRRLQPLLFAQHYPPENDRLAGEVIFWRIVLMPYSRVRTAVQKSATVAAGWACCGRC